MPPLAKTPLPAYEIPIPTRCFCVICEAETEAPGLCAECRGVRVLADAFGDRR